MGAGCQTCKSKQSHLAVKDAVVETLVFNKVIMFVPEIIVVFELLLGEDLK